MNVPDKKTKIICTIGPASDDVAVLKNMIASGMNIARINFAHGDFDSHADTIRRIRQAEEESGKRVAVMAALPGPKMRVGVIQGEPVDLIKDSAFTLTSREITGDASKASVSFEGLHKAVKPGDTVYVNDGLIQLVVDKVQGEDVVCRVAVGGQLRSHKGVNLPGIDLGISAFTDFDRQCLEFSLDHGVDAFSQSFVQDAQDIENVRQAAREKGFEVFVIGKIERSQAVDNIDSIIEASNGIMVARGDLGVEIPIETIALVQKMIIHKANLAGRPVITATQMLESMVDNRRPTRAESTDVANAILDGTDCVMLSEESAMGSYPAAAVAMMASIARATEGSRTGGRVRRALLDDRIKGQISVEDMIALNVQETVERLGLDVIITPTATGETPRRISRLRPPAWIVAPCMDHAACQRLVFSAGVLPMHLKAHPGSWEDYAAEWLAENGMPEATVVLTQGLSTRQGTNRMEILTPGRS